MAKIVRRPDFAGGGVMPEELERMKVHTKEWIDVAFRTEPADLSVLAPAIRGIYAAAGLKVPRVVLVPSPLVMAVAGGLADAVWHLRHDATYSDTATVVATIDATLNATHIATDVTTYIATLDATDVATRNATVAATRDATRDATRNATHDATLDVTHIATLDATLNAIYIATDVATDVATRIATYDVTRIATDDVTRNAAYAAARNAIINATINATRDATRNATTRSVNGWAREIAKVFVLEQHVDLAMERVRRSMTRYQGGNMWAYWECYITAARDILGLRLPSHVPYSHWEMAARNGGFRVLHEEFCMVSDFPEFIKVDDRNRPHCADGPSHRWRDGWSLWYWHGVHVPQRWIEKHVTAAEVLAESNVEVRRAGCEILGWNMILGELNAVSIDRDDDPEVGELVQVNLPDGGTARFLRVSCPTGRNFALSVPMEMKTALEANAWTYGLTMSEFQPEGRS